MKNPEKFKAFDGKRFVVQADEKLSAFLELEAEISHAQASAEPVVACQARPYKLRSNIRLSEVLINSFCCCPHSSNLQ
jgi:hypothetical protein